MSWFPRPSSPRAAFADLLAFLRHSSREQRIGAVLAVLVTAIIVFEFVIDPQTGGTKTPEVTYVELYPSNRSDAEIVADQKKDQAERAAAEKERQLEYQRLQNKLGMD
jgi:hypothetical protein